MAGINRSLHKHAYKLGVGILWKANELLGCLVEPQDIKPIKRARRQACRIIMQTGTTDESVEFALRKYEPDLIDFLEDYPH